MITGDGCKTPCATLILIPKIGYGLRAIDYGLKSILQFIAFKSGRLQQGFDETGRYVVGLYP
jgi:hypothetical protein